MLRLGGRGITIDFSILPRCVGAVCATTVRDHEAES